MINIRETPEERAKLDALAADWGSTRTGVLREALHRLDGSVTPDARRAAQPMTEAELLQVLERESRKGNVRATELLLRRLDATKPADHDSDDNEGLDQLAELRRRRTG